MKLLEYEAKQILKCSGVAVPNFIVVKNGEKVAEQFDYPVVVKSQVPVGGRGKAGGVKIVNNDQELLETIAQISQLEIKDFLPQTLLLEPKISIEHEHYLSLIIDRETASIQLLAHQQGGVEVEGNTSDFFRINLTEDSVADIAEQVAAAYGEPKAELMTAIIKDLYACFVQNDATLLEINPLVKTTEGSYICADAKMELDDAAAFRHPNWDFEDKPGDVNFVTLDETGEVATIANGAGLAMATVDAVASAGMKPANFLDVGGGANKNSVLSAFMRIMEYTNIQAIVINIFAGITRCDEVARAVIAAREEITNLPPLFIRLSGTNYQEAAAILEAANIPMLPTLEACLEAAQEVVHA